MAKAARVSIIVSGGGKEFRKILAALYVREMVVVMTSLG